MLLICLSNIGGIHRFKSQNNRSFLDTSHDQSVYCLLYLFVHITIMLCNSAGKGAVLLFTPQQLDSSTITGHEEVVLPGTCHSLK